MKNPYEDIIHLPYSGSTTHKRMSMVDRGSQFSPFAALTGYDAAIQETGRLTDRYVDLDADEIAVVNKRLQWLKDQQDQEPEITVTYFVPDERKSGGRYVQITGNVKRVDVYEKGILLADGRMLYFSRIYSLSGEIFYET